MIRFARHQRTLRAFSSLKDQKSDSNPLKPTPAAGFRIPKERSTEKVIGHRVYGDTNIFAKPVNYNYEMRRVNEEKNRHRLIKFLVALSAVPIGTFLYNAEETFKKSQLKQRSSFRRERLDREHGIDRDKMTEDFEQLDKFYRYTEKKEIEKFNRIGKTTKEFYDQ